MPLYLGRATPEARPRGDASSKTNSKMFPWRSYYRTGGFQTAPSDGLPIGACVGDSAKEAFVAPNSESTPMAARPRPPLLSLTIPTARHHHPTCLSPASARHNAALVNSASNLLAVVNDMLRSPALSGTVCTRAAAEIHKPLPSRPRSASLPCNPPPAVELPGSILLENQGFTLPPGADLATMSPSLRNSPGGTPSGPGPATIRPTPSRLPQHKSSRSDVSLPSRGKSRPSLVTSPSSTDSKLTTCSESTHSGPSSTISSTKGRVGIEKLLEPSPLIIEKKSGKCANGSSSTLREEHRSTTSRPITVRDGRDKQTEELKATITAQDSNISTLQAQFSSLRASHEAHIASLVDAHAAEVASLRNYARVLEEQQSQRTLHHASSNHLLLFLDQGDPQTPSRESPQTPGASSSANSTKTFKTAFEQQTRSPLSRRDYSEMDMLKRKLSSARRPEAGSRDTIRELNLYKQNNTALQKQVELLMAKVNQQKEVERNLTATLERVEKTCSEWQEKASKVEQLEKGTSALQNTIEHLEHRLEVANADKVDAEEQVYLLQHGRSHFEPQALRFPQPPRLDTTRDSVRVSMSTVFSTGSPIDHATDGQDSSTLAAFISHIERLQEQVRQQEQMLTDFTQDNAQLRDNLERLEQERRQLNLELDTQNLLLRKAKESDAHIDELRTVIINRESVIAEKEKALRIAEKQLEHHKLLLQAEIRRHATVSLYQQSREDPLPELSSLASKADIDRWIQRLRTRLEKEKPQERKSEDQDPAARIRALEDEIEFYVREIIYYKLDVKGYKSDIKKLKHIAMRMGSYGNRASDIESPTPSQGLSGDTPVRTHYFPEADTSGTASPVTCGSLLSSQPARLPSTSPAALPTPESESSKTFGSPLRFHRPPMPMTPQTPPRKIHIDLSTSAEHDTPGVSPRSMAPLSPERRKPTPPTPDQEKFGDMATNFPLGTPAAPKRHDTQRSMSESIIQLYTHPRTPDWRPSPSPGRTLPTDAHQSPAHQTAPCRQRSVSQPEPQKGKTTPERPPRPLYGLYDATPGPRTPPRKDVMAEALRDSPNDANNNPQPTTSSDISKPIFSTLRGFSNSHLFRTGSASSATGIPAPVPLRSRAGSAASSTGGIAIPNSPARKMSTSSGGSIPYIINMPSPHNPALISPTASVPPTSCSITGKHAAVTSSRLPPSSAANRAGVGGTMASSTPVSSPVDAKPNLFEAAAPQVKQNGSRTASLSMAIPMKRDAESGFAQKGNGHGHGHSRSVSASSFRNAMQLPGALIKGMGKTRKESISHPVLLASPFDSGAGGVGRERVGQVV
ncbi:hypothetical protein M011DRAFT_472622 [Sporormia fimetaria CBS 119925]|uniref:Uncharacterized protein n=1 Tax=Sporormia fimetaria CBS 119925 TaxID=1340428 RepID=A0A6A6UUL7_9PLEO|nr:hypothetical protein M011DRAFT_472622 [Sporormia fimetaria CBS 119925]